MHKAPPLPLYLLFPFLLHTPPSLLPLPPLPPLSFPLSFSPPLTTPPSSPLSFPYLPLPPSASSLPSPFPHLVFTTAQIFFLFLLVMQRRAGEGGEGGRARENPSQNSLIKSIVCAPTSSERVLRRCVPRPGRNRRLNHAFSQKCPQSLAAHAPTHIRTDLRHARPERYETLIHADTHRCGCLMPVLRGEDVPEDLRGTRRTRPEGRILCTDGKT